MLTKIIAFLCIATNPGTSACNPLLNENYTYPPATLI